MRQKSRRVKMGYSTPPNSADKEGFFEKEEPLSNGSLAGTIPARNLRRRAKKWGEIVTGGYSFFYAPSPIFYLT